MTGDPDALVVGAGPCGSFTALKLAKLGRFVTVFEEHSQIGVPTHCAGHLSIRSLKKLGLYPLPTGIIENTFSGVNFYSPTGKQFSLRLNQPVTCTVDREKFDEYIAGKAEEAGAIYRLNSKVEAVIFENSYAKGVIANHHDLRETVRTNLIVDAEGISSKLTKQAGFPAFHRLLKAVEAEVDNFKDTESDAVDVYLGNNYAPGFYAWLIPIKNGKAKVGLATKTGNPKELLQKLMHKHPAASKKLESARTLKTSFHLITLGGQRPQICSNGFLVVGDAASHVKPTTGGGIILGMTCAELAAEVVHEAVSNNEFSKEFLAKYQRLCTEALGFDMKMMLKMRETLDTLPDQKVDRIISMCSRLGLDKAFRNVEEIDLQGRTLLHTLRSPRMLAALAYFLYAFTSANL